MTQAQRFALIAEYSKDRDRLLRDDHRTPAEALADVVKSLGWSIQKQPLPPDRLSQCCPNTKTVTVTRDLANRLDVKSATKYVALGCLAHELAHIRLHVGKPITRIPKRWEQEARLYAMVFLCPWHRLVRSRFWRVYENNLAAKPWQPIYLMAKELHVTPSFLAATLQAYDLLRYDGAGQPRCPVTLTRRFWRHAA